MKKHLGLACLYLLIGCDNSTQSLSNSPGLQVTLAKCQSHEGAAKIGVGTPKEGELIFASNDSISFSINVLLNCEAKYSFSTAVIASDTLSMEAIDVGDSRAKCVCEREITAQYKAMAGEDFSDIMVVKFADVVYRLSAN